MVSLRDVYLIVTHIARPRLRLPVGVRVGLVNEVIPGTPIHRIRTPSEIQERHLEAEISPPQHRLVERERGNAERV